MHAPSWPGVLVGRIFRRFLPQLEDLVLVLGELQIWVILLHFRHHPFFERLVQRLGAQDLAAGSPGAGNAEGIQRTVQTARGNIFRVQRLVGGPADQLVLRPGQHLIRVGEQRVHNSFRLLPLLPQLLLLQLFRLFPFRLLLRLDLLVSSAHQGVLQHAEVVVLLLSLPFFAQGRRFLRLASGAQVGLLLRQQRGLFLPLARRFIRLGGC
mmetsp:Transcript_9284/g.26507  ORF Transcript_9284/g.26507 Transcript_9284/m.26507 type:complete len:210 (+) Transcript_9284:456-1085(+)